MHVSILIASCGRPAMLHETIASLKRQTVQADCIIVSVASEKDILPETYHEPNIKVILAGKPSLTAQRNVALDNTPANTDLVIFLDDDVEASADYVERAQKYIASHPDVAGMCGETVGGTIQEREEARRFLAGVNTATEAEAPSRGLYGCNMVVRYPVANQVRFDERLTYYAFMEDHDFGVRCTAFGRVTQYFGCKLVHFRTPSGRISPVRLGYVQMMNPYYLWSKGSIYFREFVARGPRYLLANLSGLVLGLGSRRDRWGALRGNLIAVKDILLHGAVPERVSQVGTNS